VSGPETVGAIDAMKIPSSVKHDAARSLFALFSARSNAATTSRISLSAFT
jgi:hypothetical protein